MFVTIKRLVFILTLVYAFNIYASNPIFYPIYFRFLKSISLK